MPCYEQPFDDQPHGSYQTSVGENNWNCRNPFSGPGGQFNGFYKPQTKPGSPVHGAVPIINQTRPGAVNDSSSSPDTLPAKGYTFDQLASYIERQLGAPQWIVELTKQQIIDKINDAIIKYSLWRPMIAYGAIRLQSDIHAYMQGVDVGQGIAYVEFVESRPAPTELFYGNLISPAPILSTGIDDYDMFLRWRKTWMRSSSVLPLWRYDEVNQILNIHNPIERYTCGITCYFNWNIQALPQYGATWVKEYSLALCQLLLSDIYMKYSGSIPTPGGSIQLDNAKGAKAQEKIDKLEQTLRDAQESTAIQID